MRAAVYTLDEICSLLRISKVTWYKTHRDELAKAGFPARLPRIKRWSRRQVDNWINNNGAPQQHETVDIALADTIDLDEYRAKLAGRLEN